MIGAAVDRKALAFTYNDVERIVEPWKLSFTWPLVSEWL